MKITLLQIPLVWADSTANLTMSEEALLSAPQSDVYVLPEMFTTGFLMQPEGVVSSADDALTWMKEMSVKLNAAIAGSVAVREGGNYYNRLYFVKPDGSVAHYDKRHLFTYGGEKRCYTPGNERTIVEWGGVRFCLQICYDLRFPCFSRNIPVSSLTPHPSSFTPHPSSSSFTPHPSSLIPYDCLLYVASWPASRRSVWDVLLRARAIENQCYVIGVNRIGDDPVCHYDGGTAVIDAYGRTVIQARDNTQDIISCHLDMEKLRAFRKKFPVLQDAD